MNDLQQPGAHAHPSPGDSGTPITKPSTAARLLMWLVLAVVVVHAAAMAIWIAPSNLAERIVGPDRLRSYALPMFDQSWSVFAPKADSGYSLFEIRGEHDGVRTPWTPVTYKEVIANIKYHPFPSRTGSASPRLADDLLRSVRALSTGQRSALTDLDDDVAVPGLDARLRNASSNTSERNSAAAFVKVETAIEYYLSGVAQAIWGNDVQHVQYRLYRISVTPYLANSPHRQVKEKPSYYSAWRPLHPLTPGDRSAFGAYVREFGIGGR